LITKQLQITDYDMTIQQLITSRSRRQWKTVAA